MRGFLASLRMTNIRVSGGNLAAMGNMVQMTIGNVV
jgi:hypothetical protein